MAVRIVTLLGILGRKGRYADPNPLGIRGFRARFVIRAAIRLSRVRIGWRLDATTSLDVWPAPLVGDISL